MAERSPEAALNPAALSLPDAAMALTRAGGAPVTEEALRADIEAGAPANADGTLNLVRYAAWLVRESGARSPESGARHSTSGAAAALSGSSAPDSRLGAPDCAD